MANQVNAILIHESDNVVTALADIGAGEPAIFQKRGAMVELAAVETIPAFHKMAVTDIPRMEPIRKYGEVMGQAVTDICKGAHVHDHNIVSPGRRM